MHPRALPTRRTTIDITRLRHVPTSCAHVPSPTPHTCHTPVARLTPNQLGCCSCRLGVHEPELDAYARRQPVRGGCCEAS